MDRQTDGWGRCNISRPGHLARREIKNSESVVGFFKIFNTKVQEETIVAKVHSNWCTPKLFETQRVTNKRNVHAHVTIAINQRIIIVSQLHIYPIVPIKHAKSNIPYFTEYTHSNTPGIKNMPHPSFGVILFYIYPHQQQKRIMTCNNSKPQNKKLISKIFFHPTNQLK